jgi:hypothetical protein
MGRYQTGQERHYTVIALRVLVQVRYDYAANLLLASLG